MQVLAEKSPKKTTIPLCKNGQTTTTTRNSGKIYLFPVSGAYGARYLDPRTSRWISADPAVGDYIPSAPVDDEAKKRNGNLPGMGGVYNLVNLHVYHYAGNNPVKYVDPDGRTEIDYDNKIINADLADIKDLDIANRQLSILQNEGFKVVASGKDGNQMSFDSFGTLTDYLNRVDPSAPCSGTLFLGIQIDLVAILGTSASVNLALDFDDLLNTGLNFSGGPAAGANVGVSVGIGYVKGSLEGFAPLSVDTNLGVLPISFTVTTDSNGITGGNLGIGPGGGLSASSQYSWTFSPRKINNWIQRR